MALPESPVRLVLRRGFEWAEAALDLPFGAAWNPLANLGALGFFFYWIVAASGIYVYVFFDTGTTEAFESVEALTTTQWYLGGVMRSLHRYASDALVLVMVVHVLREYALGRFRGPRWFSWFTGVPVAWLVVVSGITGYWLVWDRLAQYVATATTELFDMLPIFGEPIARNFLSSENLNDRFFTLMMFVHIAVPLILLLVLWLHLQRVAKPRFNPPRGLALGVFAVMLALAFVFPARSQGPADLNTMPPSLDLDWFYLWGYPLIDLWGGWTWAFIGVVTLILATVPWMPPMRRAKPAVVSLENCNGCGQCVEDCPFSAVSLAPRSDGRPFENEAAVNASLCTSCGICVGACPTAIPFRRRSALVPGIDLADRPLAALREEIESALAGLSASPRVLAVGCSHGARLDGLRSASVGTVRLSCLGALPVSFVDYVLSRGLADGVLLAGCSETACFNRLGVRWTQARLAGTRDPHLRPRVPRDRLELCWAASSQNATVRRALEALIRRLSDRAGTGVPAGLRGAPGDD